jgi:hypothetical protein
MNINWISRQAARIAASVLVVGIGCLLASCGGAAGAPGLQSIEITPPNGQAPVGISLHRCDAAVDPGHPIQCKPTQRS